MVQWLVAGMEKNTSKGFREGPQLGPYEVDRLSRTAKPIHLLAVVLLVRVSSLNDVTTMRI